MPSAVEKKRVLDAAFSGQNMQIALLVDSPTIGTVTFTPATDTVNHPGHDYVNGCRVRFSTTGTLDGLSTGTTYRVVQAATGTYKLAIEANYDPLTGTASAVVDIAGAGTGTHTATEERFVEAFDSSVAQLIRKEVASYQGSGRQQITVPAAGISGANAAIAAQTFPNVAPTAGAISFCYTVYLIGGSTTRGNTSGAVVAILDSGTRTIPQNGTYAATWGGTQA